MATAIPLPDYAREESEPTAAEYDELRRELVKARNLIRAISRTEPKPAKREELEEDPKDLTIIGYSIALAAIKTRCNLFLERRM